MYIPDGKTADPLIYSRLPHQISYAAPELILSQGSPIDLKKVDMWACGVLLVRLLTMKDIFSEMDNIKKNSD